VFLYNTALDKAKSLKEGDMVSWNSSGGRATGKVIHVMDYGTLDIPNVKFKIKGEKDNPAVLIQLYRDGKETDIQVGHKMSSLTKSLDEQLLKHASHNQSSHGRKGGGGGMGAEAAAAEAEADAREKYYDAGYDDGLMEEMEEKLFEVDEQFENVKLELLDDMDAAGASGANSVKRRMDFLDRAQDNVDQARARVGDASRPVNTNSLFDAHRTDVVEAINQLDDAAEELKNSPTYFAELISEIGGVKAILQKYDDDIDESVLKKNLVSKHASHNQSSHGKGGGAGTSETKSFTPAKISAKDIKVGDRLDKAGKTRVHAVKMIGDKIAVGLKTRGSGTGGFASWNPEENITVFRKELSVGFLKHGSHNQKTHAGSRGGGASGGGSSSTRATPTTMPFRPTGKDKLDEALFTRLDRRESNAAYVKGWKEGQAQSTDDKLFNAANSWIDMTDKSINEGKMPNDGFLLETARAVGLVNGVLQAK